MNVYESPAVSEERVAADVVARHPVPNDVKSITVRFGLDHSDEKALWIVFTLRDDIEETQDTYRSIYAFADAIRPMLREAGIERFAYVRINDAASDQQNQVAS